MGVDEQRNIYVYGGLDGATYDATVAHVRTPHHDMDKPTVVKKYGSVASVASGSWSIKMGAVADRTDLFELVANVSGPSIAQRRIPVAGHGTHVALDVSSTGSGPAVLASLAINYETNEKL